MTSRTIQIRSGAGRRLLGWSLALAAGAHVLLASATGAETARDAGAGIHPVVSIEDVEKFYALYDAAKGNPTAEQLQRYIDTGTSGLQVLARVRNVTGKRIAESIARQPALYENARRCAETLPRVRSRLAASLGRLRSLYPEARLPPITIAVGRGKPVGVGHPDTGVQIGLEALCATHYLNPDVEDRFVYVIAHEFAHVQQSPAFVDAKVPTVLDASLGEGIAEFVGELISGGVAYAYFEDLVAGRELEIETAFAKDMHSTDLSGWLYNGTPDKPGDLGYWVGYRIAKSYYVHAKDKQAAVRDMLQLTDAKAFLAKSGWHPGIRLPE